MILSCSGSLTLFGFVLPGARHLVKGVKGDEGLTVRNGYSEIAPEFAKWLVE